MHGYSLWQSARYCSCESTIDDQIALKENNVTNATMTKTIGEEDIRQYITEANLQSCFDTNDIPDPDLFMGTSGDVRLSNFFL